jgi:gas vesicle protein
MAKDDSGNAIAWFVVGAAMGAVIALLYAPKTGKDTRKFLNRTTREGRQAVGESGKEIMEKGRDLYERGRQIADDAADLFERGRKLVRH